MHSEHNTQHTRECKLDVKFTRDEILWQRMNQSGKWETWIWMKRREEEREREKEKEDERDWNLQRVTSLLLVWLGGGIAGCGDGCELKSSKFMICKQISSTSLLISAITSLHRNLVPVTEKKKKNNIHHHHRPRWTNDILRTLFFPFHRHTNWWIRESKKNSKSFKINAALKRNTNAYYYVNVRVYSDDDQRFTERNTETRYCFRGLRSNTNIDFQVLYYRGNYIGIR